LDYFRIGIEDEAAIEALRDAAHSNGRSVEEEIATIVLDSAPVKARAIRKSDPDAVPGENWVDELIRLGRGLNIEFPPLFSQRLDIPDL